MITVTLEEYIKQELLNDNFTEFYDSENNLVWSNNKNSFLKKMLYFDDDVYFIVTDKFFVDFSFSDLTFDRKFKKMFLEKFINRQIRGQTIEDFASQVLFTTLALESYIETLISDYKKMSENRKYSNAKNTKQNEQNKKTDETENKTKDNSQNEKYNVDNTENEITNSTAVNDTRSINSTLPQDQINLNVSNTELDFADENSLSKQKGTIESERTNNSSSSSNTDSTFLENENTTANELENTTFAENAELDNTSVSYNFDTLFKSYDIFFSILNTYDKNCFLQTW